MNAVLFQLANKTMNVMTNSPLLDEEPKEEAAAPWYQQVINAINTALWPILGIVAAIGTIYAVWLGVNLAKADSSDKREEAKKRLITFVIALVVVVVLILLLKLFFNTALSRYLDTEKPDDLTV